MWASPCQCSRSWCAAVPPAVDHRRMLWASLWVSCSPQAVGSKDTTPNSQQRQQAGIEWLFIRDREFAHWFSDTFGACVSRALPHASANNKAHRSSKWATFTYSISNIKSKSVSCTGDGVIPLFLNRNNYIVSIVSIEATDNSTNKLF